MTVRLVGFNFFEQGLRNIIFHVCYALIISGLTCFLESWYGDGHAEVHGHA